MPLIGRVAGRVRASGWPRRCGSPTRPASAGPWPSWLVDGHCSSFDLHECDVNRFEPHQLAPRVRPHPRLPELRRGLRHPAPAAADRRTCARCAPARSTRASASSAPCSWRRPAGSARSGTRPTPGCVDGRDIPQPERLGRAVLVADRRRRGAGDPRGRRDVRHDRAEAARGDRPRGRRVPATAWSPATSTSPSARSPTACCSTSTAASAATSPSPGSARDRFQVGANGNLDLDWLRRHLPPDGTGAGPRHHAGHLLHRPLGPAGPRPASSR